MFYPFQELEAAEGGQCPQDTISKEELSRRCVSVKTPVHWWWAVPPPQGQEAWGGPHSNLSPSTLAVTGEDLSPGLDMMPGLFTVSLGVFCLLNHTQRRMKQKIM